MGTAGRGLGADNRPGDRQPDKSNSQNIKH